MPTQPAPSAPEDVYTPPPPSYQQPSYQQPTSYQQPPGYSQPPYSSAPSASGLQPNIAGLLCYVLGLVTGILFLVLDPYNKDRFVRFHAFQSIFLNVTFIIAYICLGILEAIFPWFLDFIPTLAMLGVWLGTFVLFIIAMIKAYNGDKFKIPVIGEIAEKQAGV